LDAEDRGPAFRSRLCERGLCERVLCAERRCQQQGGEVFFNSAHGVSPAADSMRGLRQQDG
jgi:hypothetical protein